MTEKTTDVAVKEFQLPSTALNLEEAMAEEMDGLEFRFDVVKIPSGGGLAFEIPGDDPDNPEMVKELVGIIIDHHPANAYWADEFSGQNATPDCMSNDGKMGIGNPGGNCANCQMNQWGSGRNGGRACKNTRRVYLLREGDIMPILLILPPSSLKNIADYLAKRIIAKGRRSYSVVTKVTLRKKQNKDGITYSEAVFSVVRDLTPEEAEKAKKLSEQFKPLTRNVQLEDYEYYEPNAEGLDDQPF